MAQEFTCDSRPSSEDTCDTLSRKNSLSSLPETECEWPDLDFPISRPTTPGQPLPAVFMTSPAPQAGEIGMGPPGRFMPAGELASQPLQTSSFQVAYAGGIEVRTGPFDAPATGLILMPNEIFDVSQEVVGSDGCIYLRLADGRGWVFDDTKLMPHDPSVVRCPCASPQSGTAFPQALATPPSSAVLPPYMPSPPPPPSQRPNAEVYLPPPPPPPPMVAPSSRGELLASTPVNSTPMMIGSPDPMQMPVAQPVASMTPISWFRVAYLGGIQLRCTPSIDAPLTGITLAVNETFPVAEEILSADGRLYLRLADGRGWAFDDTNLMPHDPSVKRGSWMSLQPNGCPMVFPCSQADALPVRRRRMYPQPRGKRGGKRCSKRKQAAAAAVTVTEG